MTNRKPLPKGKKKTTEEDEAEARRRVAAANEQTGMKKRSWMESLSPIGRSAAVEAQASGNKRVATAPPSSKSKPNPDNLNPELPQPQTSTPTPDPSAEPVSASVESPQPSPAPLPMDGQEPTTASADQSQLPVTEARFVHDPSPEEPTSEESTGTNDGANYEDGQANEEEQTGQGGPVNNDVQDGQENWRSEGEATPASGVIIPADDDSEEVQYLRTRPLTLEERASREHSLGNDQAQGAAVASGPASRVVVPPQASLPILTSNGQALQTTAAPHGPVGLAPPSDQTMGNLLHILQVHAEQRGGEQALERLTESPRLRLLKQACEQHDAFFVVLHQVYCIWQMDRQQAYLRLPGLDREHVVDAGFSCIQNLIKPNDNIAHGLLQLLINLPVCNIEPHLPEYRVALREIRLFLMVSATYPRLLKAAVSRGYPFLVEELLCHLYCVSPTLQYVMYLSCIRQCLKQVGDVAVQAAPQFEQLFRQDQKNHQDAQGAFPPARKIVPIRPDIHTRNAALIHQYESLLAKVAAEVQAQQQRRQSTSQVSQQPQQNLAPNTGVAAMSQQPGAPSSYNGQALPQGLMVQGGGSLHHRPAPAGFAVPSNQATVRQPLMIASVQNTAQAYSYPSQVLGTQASPHQQAFAQRAGMQAFIHQQQPQGQQPQNKRQPRLPRQQQQKPQEQEQQPQEKSQQRLPPRKQIQRLQLHPVQQQQQQQQQQQYPQQQSTQPMQVQPVSTQVLTPSYMATWHPDQMAYALQQRQLFQQQQQFSLATSQAHGQQAGQQIHCQMPLPILSPPFRTEASPVQRQNTATPDQARRDNGQPLPVPVPVSHSLNILTREGSGQEDQDRLIPPRGRLVHPHNGNFSVINGMAAHQPRAISPRRYIRHDAGEKPGERYFQAIIRFAMPPQLIARERMLLKFTFDVPDEQYKLKTKELQTDLPATEQFSGALRWRSRVCLVKPSKDVLQEHIWVVTPTTWPKSFTPSLNGHHFQPLRNSHNAKDQPAEVTHIIRPGENELRIAYKTGDKPTGALFAIAIEVIETLAETTIKNYVLRRGVLPADTALDRIVSRARQQNSLSRKSDDSLEILSDDLGIDLCDPWFSTKIFNTPVRGKNCTHFECFDLDNFLSSRYPKQLAAALECPHTYSGRDFGVIECDCVKKEEVSKVDDWKCPKCDGDARPCSLQIDGFLVEVRKTLEEEGKLNAKKLNVSVDGTWRTDGTVGGDSDEPDSDDDDDEPLVRPRASAKRSRDPSQAEVIVLD